MDHTVLEIKLDNGAEGLLIHVPGARVMSFQLEFRAGEYLVDDDKWETPHLLEHVLLGANKQYPKTKLFQAEIEKNGAYSSASTSVYDIAYEAECADFEWERILDLLLLAMARPLFLKDEFETEFSNVREELIVRSNDRFRHLSLRLRKEHGLIAKTDQERLRIMQNVSIADVTDHYHATHTTRNLRFIIAGNITPRRRGIITESLAAMGLPTGTGRFELPDEHPVRPDKPVFLHSKLFKNIYFRIDSFVARPLTNSEKDALGLANTMLTETLYSKILGTARERGLVYDMTSGFGQTRQSSSWWFEAQVSKKNALAFFDIIAAELRNVLAGKVTDTDIEAAKAYALGRFQRSAQTVRGTADSYNSRYFFEGAVDDYHQIPKRIEATTKNSMVDIARQLFEDKIWGLGVLGNCEGEFVNELNSRIAPLWDKSY